ncbi:unnamed protein product, partial [Closterium sp. NIES-54]
GTRVAPYCFDGSEVHADPEKQSRGDTSTDSDVVEVNTEEPEPRRSGRLQRPPEFLTYHLCLPPAAFMTLYDNIKDEMLNDDAEDDVDLPELEFDMYADPEHRWDIATMTGKE